MRQMKRQRERSKGTTDEGNEMSNACINHVKLRHLCGVLRLSGINNFGEQYAYLAHAKSNAGKICGAR